MDHFLKCSSILRFVFLKISVPKNKYLHMGYNNGPPLFFLNYARELHVISLRRRIKNTKGANGV
jgi:hypothetical protein